MYKNVASQKIAVYAWDGANGVAKTGDAANITAQISKGGAASAATNDANPTELDATDHPGVYIFDLTQAETNADLVVITPVSSTTDINFRPSIVYTDPLTPTKAGYIDHSIATVDTVVDGIQTDLSNATDGLGALKALIDAAKTVVDAVKAKTDNLPADPADDSDIDAQLATIAGYLDTEIAAILAAVDTEVAAIKAKTDNLPADPASETNVDANETKIDTIDTVVDGIKTITDNLPDAGALSSLATAAALTTVDTVVDAIKAQTDDLPSGVKKNVALANFEFLMIDSSDHLSPKTGLTITAEISKDGGAFASCTNSASEISDGVYKITITQAEMNADIITLKFTATGADQRTITIKTSA